MIQSVTLPEQENECPNCQSRNTWTVENTCHCWVCGWSTLVDELDEIEAKANEEPVENDN